MTFAKKSIFRYLLLTAAAALALILLWLSISDILLLKRISNINNFSQNNYTSCAVILPKNEMYWKEFLEEFDQFAQSQKVLTETIFYATESEEAFGLKLALFSKFDFVIICDLFNSPEIKRLIDDLQNQGIKIISILNRNLKDYFDITIGFDYLQKGKIVAQNIKKLAEQKGIYDVRIALITNTINQKVADNFEAEGIKSYLKQYGVQFSIDSFVIEYGNAKSEKLLHRIITNPKYNCYYTTEELETFAFIDSLVKNPKDTSFLFIGTGDDSRLLRYRDEGLIDCLIMPNYDELAIRSVLTIKDFEKIHFKKQFIPTSIIVK
ncbi:sugar ABC transporter substrate-binding protein [Caldicellulosiruptor changbaiensis]|uniref:Sugar ABC transporter substrate-binding protein n=1 Tax=Caldicellulosiruptor changbaiensis TaxID=1222016 RepID=A0A3T0D8X7_9FIRM|nr:MULTISPECIES: substrate-binding domain-containing protein [Caldicellulosiruptor]AZT91494.1 sugar ABC transporter substrate-binding protein [Caldicellulosiruptor changbaiensis]